MLVVFIQKLLISASEKYLNKTFICYEWVFIKKEIQLKTKY